MYTTMYIIGIRTISEERICLCLPDPRQSMQYNVRTVFDLSHSKNHHVQLPEITIMMLRFVTATIDS